MRARLLPGLTNQHVPPRAVQLVNGPTKPDRLCRRGGAPFNEMVMAASKRDVSFALMPP